MHKAQENKIKESGVVGKWAIVGVKDQKIKHVTVTVVPNAKRETLCKLDLTLVEPGVTVYTDDATAYFALVEFDDESVKYSVGQDVKGLVHTTRMESLPSMLNRGHVATYHKIRKKDLQRYIKDYAGDQIIC